MSGGRINKTIKISVKNKGEDKKYLLQSINTYVFKNAKSLMNNIINVTMHIRGKGKKTLNFIPLKNNANEYLYIEKDDICWRMYEYIDANVISNISNPSDIELLGNAIADFNISLNDFDVNNVIETIPDFHNTQKRYETFCDILEKCTKQDYYKVETAKEEIEYLHSKKACYNIVEGKMKDCVIPKRLTHNDPKINNILFDNQTGKPICMIDLDTVMPGSILYDIGDAIRSGCSQLLEDNDRSTKNKINLELYESFVKGFIGRMGENITNTEKALIPFSAWLISVELGMRYLTDYLDGNKYFEVEYEIQNLERAKTQIELAIDIEKNIEKMKDIVNKY